MAEIDVERKGPSIWPWIIGLVVLALLIWLLVELFDDDTDELIIDDPIATDTFGVQPAPIATGDVALTAAVQSYLETCAAPAPADAQDMGAEHEYTVSCLEQLRDGISSLIADGDAGVDASARFEEYEGTVDALAASVPGSTEHAGMTRTAAMTAAEVLESMRAEWAANDGDLEGTVTNVEQAAAGIDGDTQMLEQRESVHTFFREAGAALRMIAERRRVATI
jgi:hypothetical protein